MKAFIEQLHPEKSVLFIGPAVSRSDDWQAACCSLAQLPYSKVVSLAGGSDLADAWRQAGRLVDELRPSAAGPPLVDDRRVTWLDLSVASQGAPWLVPLLRTWLATHAVCFFGCDLEDAGFKQRYREWAETVGPHRPRYHAVLQRDLAEGDRRNWEAQNVALEVAHPVEWARNLVAACADASQRLMTTPSQVPFTGSPYPFLDSFAEQDAGRFFGRIEAIRDLGELVLAEQLVVCFGPSGVGKSSLLQAGLAPRLRQQGCLPLYCRPEGDPVASIRRAVFRAEDDAAAGEKVGPVANRPYTPIPRSARAQASDPAASYPGLAETLAALARRSQRTVVVLLDQFEEVFTLLGEDTASHLAVELAACLRQPEGAVRVVLSLREDYLARLHALQPVLPQVFAHRFRLRPLSRAEARQAIVAPAELCGLSYEPALANQLLSDLGRDDAVEPADVQIVCDALYRDLQASGDSVFRLARYEALGSAESLLAGYLERVVAQEPDPDRVRAVLKSMVTSQGTRTLLSPADIAFLSDTDESTVSAVLQRLDRPHRLVRPLQQEGELRYELAHEVLGPRILAWVTDPLEQEARAVHDLLRSERHNWRQFGALPGPGKVQAIYAQRDNPRLRLSTSDLAMIVQAALHSDADPAYWLERAEAAGVPAGDFLLPALSSSQSEVRELAARLLGPSAASELDRLLRSASEPEVRANAAMTLGELEPEGGWRSLQRARHDPDEDVRAAVWQGLETIDEGAAGRLRRRDEAQPLLAVASLAFWAVLALARIQGLLPAGWPVWALAGMLWVAALVVSGWLIPGLQTVGRRLLGGGLALASAWLLVATWDRFRGLIALVVAPHGLLLGLVYLVVVVVVAAVLGTLVLEFLVEAALLLWRKVYLLMAAALGCLAFLIFVAPTPAIFLSVTSASILGLSALTLAVPRWRGSSLDQGAAVAIVGAGLGALVAQLLIRSPVDTPGALLLLACSLALARWAARRPLSYSYDTNSYDTKGLVAEIANGTRNAVWDSLDILSFNLKPLVGGIAGAMWTAVLIGAATALSPGSQPAWTISDALLLSAGLGLGLWPGLGGPVWAMLLPALGGALGGALAQGVQGAVAGACIGVGLGLGEYLGNRLLSARNEPAEPATRA